MTAPNIKLVLTDFDGTVAEFGKHIVSERVRQAVISCEDKGIRMVPITGRYYEMARPVLEVLGFEDLGVFDNGASIQNCKTGELLRSKWIEPAMVQRIAVIMAPAARIIDYSPEHDVHSPADDEMNRIAAVVQPTSHVFGLIGLDRLTEVTDQLAKLPDITFYAAPSTRGETDCMGIQVNHRDADKYHGVAALRSMIGIAKSNTLAIGDGDNDIRLFENASLKIAMGNATAQLKAAADYVVAPVAEDGFVEAMERFVLPYATSGSTLQSAVLAPD